MAWMVSLLNGQLIILIVFKAPQIQTKAADYEDNLIMLAQWFKSSLAWHGHAVALLSKSCECFIYFFFSQAIT